MLVYQRVMNHNQHQVFVCLLKNINEKTFRDGLANGKSKSRKNGTPQRMQAKKTPSIGIDGV